MWPSPQPKSTTVSVGRTNRAYLNSSSAVASGLAVLAW